MNSYLAKNIHPPIDSQLKNITQSWTSVDWDHYSVNNFNKFINSAKNKKRLNKTFNMLYLFLPHNNYKWNDNLDLNYLKADYTKQDGTIVSYNSKESQFDHFPSKANIESLKNAYINSLMSSDHNVGEVINNLKKLEIYDESMIVIFSDHGEDLNDSNNGSFAHGHAASYSRIDSYLTIKLPKGSKNSVKHIDHPVSLMGLFPTLFDLYGITTEKDGILNNKNFFHANSYFQKSNNENCITISSPNGFEYPEEITMIKDNVKINMMLNNRQSYANDFRLGKNKMMYVNNFEDSNPLLSSGFDIVSITDLKDKSLIADPDNSNQYDELLEEIEQKYLKNFNNCFKNLFKN